MTQDNYFGRKIVRTGAAALLEVFGEGEAVDRNCGGGSCSAPGVKPLSWGFAPPTGLEPVTLRVIDGQARWSSS